MSAEALALPAVGDIIGEGRFELGRKLGEGGMSTVFVARDRFLDRDVALKLLIPRYIGRPEREQRFLNEAEYLRRVQHHVHVTRIIDAGRLRDRNQWPWLSTEIMIGRTLDWLRIHGSLEIAEKLEIVRQLAEALHACHEAGVVHRDLTPSNVYVLEDGSVKLFDFSHAADLRAVGGRERLTRVFETPGTVGYIAPEQAINMAPHPCMDAYSFGVVLYEVVCGSHPFKQFTDRDAFLQAQVEGNLVTPRLQAWAYDAPEELAELVGDCLQRDGVKRPGMQEILTRLDGILAMMRPAAAASEAVVDDDDEATAFFPRRQAPSPAKRDDGGEARLLIPPDTDLDARGIFAVVRKPSPAKHDDGGEATAFMPVVRAPSPSPNVDVTAPVDAPAIIAAKPRRPDRPELDGDWTKGRGLMQVAAREMEVASPSSPSPESVTWAAPAPVVAEAAPTWEAPKPESEERTDVVPFARPPATAVAAASEEQTGVLAFARPPQLREAASGSTVVPSTIGASRPPELRLPIESRPSADFDPETHAPVAARDEGEDEIPPPIGLSRGKIAGLVLGIGVLVTILAWVGYSKFFGGGPEKELDSDSERAGSSHEPQADTDSASVPAEDEEGADDFEAVAETGGETEVDPVEDPKPKTGNGKPKTNGKTDGGKQDGGKTDGGKTDGGKSDGGKQDIPPEPASPECKDIDQKAKTAASKRDWKAVLDYTSRAKCWSSKSDRQKFEVQAYANLGQWTKCVAAGE